MKRYSVCLLFLCTLKAFAYDYYDTSGDGAYVVDGFKYFYTLEGNTCTLARQEGDATTVTIPRYVSLPSARHYSSDSSTFRDPYDATWDPAAATFWEWDNFRLYEVTSVETDIIAENVVVELSPDKVKGFLIYNPKTGHVSFWGKVRKVSGFGEGVRSVEWPDGLEEIGSGAFSGSQVTEIKIPGGVVLGTDMFAYCQTITKVIFESGVDCIPEGMFENCFNLKTVKIPEGVREIEDDAFRQCHSLGRVDFPESLQKIGEDAFYYCTNMSVATWPKDLLEIGEGAFMYASVSNLDFSCTQLERIGDFSFANCNKVVSELSFPATVTYIGSNAFNLIGEKVVEFIPDDIETYNIVRFAGLPPEMGDDVFTEDRRKINLPNSYRRGLYPIEYAKQWKLSIKEWASTHTHSFTGDENWWHQIRMEASVVVEPIDWTPIGSNQQTLTLCWHCQTNSICDIDAAKAKLLALGKKYNVWRGKDDPYDYANFSKADKIATSISGLTYPDTDFGKIKGTHPVRYWLQVLEEGENANERPSETPNAFCDTRRRFGLAIGLSEYAAPYGNPNCHPEPFVSCVNDVKLFDSMFKRFDGVEDGQIRQIINQDATVAAIRQGISQFPFAEDGHIRFVPGDIAMLYMMSHGVDAEKNDENFWFAAYDNLYGNGEFANDIKWLGTLPGVRMVAMLPFCNSGGFAKKCSYPNFSCVYGAGLHESSTLHVNRRQSQYGHYLMDCGWRNGCAGRSTVKGLSRCPWKAEVAEVFAPGDDSQWVDFLELGRYAQLFATGSSSKHPAHAHFENEQVLSSVLAGEANLTLGTEPSSVPLKVECGTNGTIAIYYQYCGDEDDLVLWHSVDNENWDWVRMSALRGQEGVGLFDFVPLTYTRKLIFGCRDDDETNHIGKVRSYCGYYFRLQQVSQNGFGKMAITAYAETGDLSDDHSIFRNWLEQTIRYIGEFPISDDDFAPVEIEVSPADSAEEYCVALHFDLDGQDYEYTGTSTVSDNGKLTVACVRPQMKKALTANSGATALPTVITVVIGVNGAKCSPNVGETFGCIPIADDIELPEVKDADNDLPVDSSYGPFVPGEKVELKFPEGAAWKVTGLPTGLKWDAKLPGVTGVPTKPGTNTVYFVWTDKSVMPNVTHKASSTFIVGPLPVLSVRTAGEGTGKVTGAGAYATNKKVTLKATADTKDAAAKGKNPATVKSVFAGWYDTVGDLVAQTPSLSYVMPPHDVTLQARFIPASNDWATVDCVTEAGSVWVVTNETKVVLAPISVAAAGGSLPTVKVTGLPTGLKFTAKDIMKKNPKTEVDVPANTIYGTPTKGGVYNATVTVTTAGKASVVRAIKFIIRTSSDYVVDADWDPVQGKVTGAGVYQADKKVTLKATANKGYVFSGWYDGEDAVATQAGEPVSRLASYVLAMPTNDVAYVAAFVTTAEDAASIEAAVNGMALSGTSGETPPPLATNVMAGVYLAWPVAASALSETTVKVAGLPSGLKFTAKEMVISGAPTKTGLSKVEVTVTTAGKNTQVYQIDTTVDPLPAWAVGTFAGPSYDGDVTNGQAAVTIAASGKITAKQPVDGKVTSFAANYFNFYDAESDSFWATLTAKSGKTVLTNEMVVSGGVIEADLFDAWQYNWKAEPWKSEAKNLAKRDPIAYETDNGAVTLRFGSNGTVTVAGEFAKLDDEGAPVYKNGKLQTVKVSGSATLLPTVGEDGETRYLVFVYLAPKSLPPHARCLEIPHML